MAVPKLMQTEFDIHHKLESCESTINLNRFFYFLNKYSQVPNRPSKYSTVNLTRHKDSVDRTGQGNIWFVGCSTTAWATWTPGESEPCDVKDAMKKTEQVYMVHDTIYIFAP